MLDAELSIDVDRNSPMPMYFQLAEQIEQAIVGGRLEPGHRLMNEVEMATRLGLSRPTVRRGIEELVKKGLLVRRRGVGTQVVHNHLHRDVRLSSLYDDLAETRREPGTKVLHQSVIAAPNHVAAELYIPVGTPVLHLERLRTARGEPLAVLRNWLPDGLVDVTPAALESRGLYEILRASGVHLHIARQRIDAHGASPEEADLLNVGEGAPLLGMWRTAYDGRGRAVEYGSDAYLAGGYSFEVTVVES